MNIPEVEDIIAWMLNKATTMIIMILAGFLFGTGLLLSVEFYPIWRH